MAPYAKKMKSANSADAVRAVAPLASPPAATPAGGARHTWIDGDGRGIWRYCAVCRAVRHPNGKLDKNICPGPGQPKFNTKPRKSPKPPAVPAKSAPRTAAKAPRRPAPKPEKGEWQ